MADLPDAPSPDAPARDHAAFRVVDAGTSDPYLLAAKLVPRAAGIHRRFALLFNAVLAANGGRVLFQPRSSRYADPRLRILGDDTRTILQRLDDYAQWERTSKHVRRQARQEGARVARAVKAKTDKRVKAKAKLKAKGKGAKCTPHIKTKRDPYNSEDPDSPPPRATVAGSARPIRA